MPSPPSQNSGVCSMMWSSVSTVRSRSSTHPHRYAFCATRVSPRSVAAEVASWYSRYASSLRSCGTATAQSRSQSSSHPASNMRPCDATRSSSNSTGSGAATFWGGRERHKSRISIYTRAVRICLDDCAPAAECGLGASGRAPVGRPEELSSSPGRPPISKNLRLFRWRARDVKLYF